MNRLRVIAKIDLSVIVGNDELSIANRLWRKCGRARLSAVRKDLFHIVIPNSSSCEESAFLRTKADSSALQSFGMTTHP